MGHIRSDAVFQVVDKTSRLITISKERYAHILKHPEMHDQIASMLETLQRPIKMTSFSIDPQVRYYYGHQNPSTPKQDIFESSSNM